MDIKFLPGWGPSKSSGKPTRVINDTRLTVVPYIEDPTRRGWIVGGIYSPPDVSYATWEEAQVGAEQAYKEFIAGGTTLSSERAWRMEAGVRPLRGYRNFAEEYRKTQKKGDVNIFVTPKPSVPSAAVLARAKLNDTAIDTEL
jgi:hypothetical protein